MVNPASLPPQEQALVARRFGPTESSKSCVPMKQTSDPSRFRKMGRLGMGNLRSVFAREDSIKLLVDGEDTSTTPTRSTASTSFSSQNSNVESNIESCKIPDLVSTNASKKSCLRLYSNMPNHESMNTIVFDDLGAGINCDKMLKVSWNTVQFRTYETILGDNPSVSVGPPISLGWKYDVASNTIASIDDYEDRRVGRRSKEQLLVPWAARERCLMDSGYSRSEISDAVKDLMKVKQSRQQNARKGWLERGILRAILMRKRHNQPRVD